MIKVRYPNENGFNHNIEIKKIERLEGDGTFLVRGRENGYNVLLHLDVDGFGRFHKLPTSTAEYLKLMMPFTKRVDVTENLKGYLNGQNIDSLPEKQKPIDTIKMFYHPLLRKMYIYKENAIDLGFISGEKKYNNTNGIIDSNLTLINNYYEISDMQFEQIKDKYKIQVIKFKIKETKKPKHEFNHLNFAKNDDIKTFFEQRIAKLLIDLKYYLEVQGKIDDPTRQLIIQLIDHEKSINKLPNTEYKNELLNILYYDMIDLLSTVRGLNLSYERVGNYNKKADSYAKLLMMKEKELGMDLSNVKDLINDIQDNLNESYKLTSAIEPNTWSLVQTFTNNLSEVLLQDEVLFRKQIASYNKDNLLYNQIIFELRNYIEGKNNAK